MTGPGKPLEIKEIPMLEPSASETLVQVHACGVYYSDAGIVSGQYGPLSITRLGYEFLGTVVGLGSSVHKWQIDDRVGGAWHSGHDGACRSCQRSDYQMCVSKAVNGYTRDGVYGEYATVRSEAAVRVPKDMVPAEAAPLLCAGMTVFNDMRKMGITAGDVVAVQGLGGLVKFD
jgi:D-arabinose 1-dehydrogenase-like Zn-dependent alcohol dehydrogenase